MTLVNPLYNNSRYLISPIGHIKIRTISSGYCIRAQRDALGPKATSACLVGEIAGILFIYSERLPVPARCAGCECMIEYALPLTGWD